MRLTITVLALALLCTSVRADEAGAQEKPTYASVLAAHGKFIKKGIKFAKDYFQVEADIGIGKKGANETKKEKLKGGAVRDHDHSLGTPEGSPDPEATGWKPGKAPGEND